MLLSAIKKSNQNTKKNNELLCSLELLFIFATQFNW